MRAEPEEFWDAFERASGIEHDATTELRLEQALEIMDGEREPLHTDDVDGIETRSTCLCSEFTRAVGESRERSFMQRREPAGPFDLAKEVQQVGELLVDAIDEDAVEAGRPSRDRRREHEASGAHDPGSLAKRGDAIRALREVVQRPEQEDGVDGRVGRSTARASPSLESMATFAAAASSFACSTWSGTRSR